MFEAVWDEIKALHKANARHIRKNVRLGEMSANTLCEHMAEELQELKDAPDDQMEWADLFAILVHYAVSEGWDPARLEAQALTKLAARFEMPANAAGTQVTRTSRLGNCPKCGREYPFSRVCSECQMEAALAAPRLPPYLGVNEENINHGGY